MNASVSSGLVIAVVPTYNRLHLLRQCLAAVDAQTRRPDRLVIVDNCSSDGTAEWLAGWMRGRTDATVTRLDTNRGGAGGYHFGIRKAYELGANWIWTLDDDAIPEPGALAALLAAAVPGTGFVASSVLWTDGSAHVMNLPGFAGPPDANTGLRPITRASFVSILISREAVRTAGLPIKEFFIHSDDVEFTTRITARGFSAFFVDSSRIVHATPANAGITFTRLNITPEQAVPWQYTVRNLVAFNRRRPLGWLREPARLCLIAARLLSSPTPPAVRAAILKAGIAGLFMKYEKWIEYPDDAMAPAD